jgi:hypothetical protein
MRVIGNMSNMKVFSFFILLSILVNVSSHL